MVGPLRFPGTFGLIIACVPEDLPMLRREPGCPAAARIAGVDHGSQGVVCRAMQQDIERDDGTALDMSAGQFGFLQHEASAGVFLSLESDPSTVLNLCYGRGLPVLSDDDHLARDHHSYCPVWQAEVERLAEGRDQLVAEREPEPVSMGVSSADAPNPWVAARRGLEELAPEKRAA